MLINRPIFLKILNRRHHSGHTAPPQPGHIFTIDEWINHHEASHHPGDPVMGHTEKLANGRATCVEVVQEWHKWLFRIPAPIHPNLVLPSSSYRTESSGIQNPVDVNGNKVYMTSFVPLKKKEDNVITLQIYKDTKYIVLGIMTAEACTEEYPSLTTVDKLWKMVKDETDSIQEIKLIIDDIPRMGCYVERKKKLEISNVANDNLMGIKPENMKTNNTIGIIYSGFWALLDVGRLGAGDHLITVESTGKTYFIGATVALNILI